MVQSATAGLTISMSGMHKLAMDTTSSAMRRPSCQFIFTQYQSASRKQNVHQRWSSATSDDDLEKRIMK